MNEMTTSSAAAPFPDQQQHSMVTALVETLQTQFQHRLESLQADVTGLKHKQQQVCASGTVKLSKSVKHMTVREFNAAHKTDILSILLALQHANDDDHLVPTNQAALDLETPAPVTRTRRNLQTPSRTVRRGEVLYSENGSPVDMSSQAGSLVATISKKPRHGNPDAVNASTDATTTQFDLNVGAGKFISLTDPSGLQHLDDDLKTTALNQLKILQDQMASLMQHLNK